MTPTPRFLTYDEYNEKLKNMKTIKDVNSFVKDLVSPVLQQMLEAEMTEHLGYDKYERPPEKDADANARNGHTVKTIKSSFGQGELKVPRDRNGTFEPVAVKKYETVTSDIEEKITSMYAKGMTTRDIHAHMADVYGVDVSAGMVSTITDKVLPLVREWQDRPLAAVYPIVYLDGIHFKVHESGKIVNKCGYSVLGINTDGIKELLGIWIGGSEGAKFWLQVLTDIRNRGVVDIVICCVDGLKGFPEAIAAVFPDAAVQQCIVHQVRSTVKYIAHKHQDKFCADLRTIYAAPTEEAGFSALQVVKEKWPDYALALKAWEEKWPLLCTFFDYTPAIRKLIYTTNAVESLHHQFRKVTKTTTIFPHDEALTKLLWLAQNEIARKWTMPSLGWKEIITQFAIRFPERIILD